ncbi:MAG TPA: AraC family transcriptional regulator [Phycisphaerae bacterium]|nr:AraC family transcriptional regulator [Phycisphaerae bacterium]
MFISANIRYTGKTKSFTREPGFRYWSVGSIVEGDRLLHYRRKTEYIMQPGCLVLIPPCTPYTNTGYSNQREFWSFFSPIKTWDKLLEPYRSRNILSLVKYQGTPNEREMRDCMSSIIEIQGRNYTDKNTWLNNLMERMLLLARCNDRKILEYRMDDRIEKTIEFIAKNFCGYCSVKKLASIACLSPSRYAHLFKECTGIGPAAYIESVKLDKAKSLLISTSLSVSEIAGLTGFCNPFYFSQRFHEKFGCSPTAYRKNSYNTNSD